MIFLTEQAALYLSGMISKRSGCLGVVFGVKRSGCSGLSYVLDFAFGTLDGVVRFTSSGVDIYVKECDLKYLDGTKIDFVKSGLNRHLVFDNPNTQDECGCGMSFSV